MSKNTGGPAFPCDRIPMLNGTAVSSDGMSMRDYFAAHAVHAAVLKAIHNFTCDGVGDMRLGWYDVAQSAYEAADALLETRDK